MFVIRRDGEKYSEHAQTKRGLAKAISKVLRLQERFPDHKYTLEARFGQAKA